MSTAKGFLTSLFVIASYCSSAIGAPPSAVGPEAGKTPEKSEKLDRSGQPRRGKASYYASKFAGRKMADGTPMDPESNAAASNTLPLGTKAEVTNLRNGRSAVVEIRDRGPHVEGRIVDLTPKTAKKLEMHDKGVAPVIVAPLEVPQADGSIRRGVAAR